MLNGPILALDADLDVYAMVTYKLLGSQSGLFDIDNSTGEASVPPQHPQPGARASQPLDLGPPFSALDPGSPGGPHASQPNFAAGLSPLGPGKGRQQEAWSQSKGPTGA